MNEWISVKDRLPIQEPEGWPTYDWVVVTSEREGDEPWPWYIARYTKMGWEFYCNELEAPNEITCPDFSDTYNNMRIDDITHWMKIYKPGHE